LPGGGPVDQIAFFEDGARETRTYDAAYRAQHIQIVDPELITEEDVLLDYDYAYDGAGNITDIVDSVEPGRSWTYAYDPANRLTSAAAQDTANGVYTFGYGDDGLGNRQTYTANGDAYTYTYGDGSPNRLVQVAGPGGQTVSYSYDDEGRLVECNGDRFYYDAKGRMNRFENAEGSKLAFYSYDHLGRRISKSASDKTITLYHYDEQGRLIAETDADGNVQVEYIWLDWRPTAMIVPGGSTPDDDTADDDVIDDDTVDDDTIDDDTTDDDSADDDTGDDDDDDCGGCTDGGDLLENWFEQDKMGVMEQDYEVYAIHTDHLGTPVAVSDLTGQVVWTHRFSPFGKTIELNEDADGDGVKLTLNLRFPGQYYDAESGLHYNWHRYYDPETGRYLTNDTKVELISSYKYVYSRPTLLKDPTGLIVNGGISPYGSCCHKGENPPESGNGTWLGKMMYMVTHQLCRCHYYCKRDPSFGGGPEISDPRTHFELDGRCDAWSLGAFDATIGRIDEPSGCACAAGDKKIINPNVKDGFCVNMLNPDEPDEDDNDICK